MPAAHGAGLELRRPASESLQWRKPREEIREPSRGLYGDLSVARELKVG